jgi:hypothetical protein
MGLLLAAPAALGRDDEDKEKPNVKYEGYKSPVKAEEGSSLLTYGMFALATGLCVVVVFKDAKRSHMD